MSGNSIAAFAVILVAGFAGCAASARSETPAHVTAHRQIIAPQTLNAPAKAPAVRATLR